MKREYLQVALRTCCAERTRAMQLVCVCACTSYLHRTFHGNLCREDMEVQMCARGYPDAVRDNKK